MSSSLTEAYLEGQSYLKVYKVSLHLTHSDPVLLDF